MLIPVLLLVGGDLLLVSGRDSGQTPPGAPHDESDPASPGPASKDADAVAHERSSLLTGPPQEPLPCTEAAPDASGTARAVDPAGDLPCGEVQGRSPAHHPRPGAASGVTDPTRERANPSDTPADPRPGETPDLTDETLWRIGEDGHPVAPVEAEGQCVRYEDGSLDCDLLERLAEDALAGRDLPGQARWLLAQAAAAQEQTGEDTVDEQTFDPAAAGEEPADDEGSLP